MIHYPYATTRGKNSRREAYKTAGKRRGIGTAIDNAERNSTFSPYSYILSQMKKIRCRLIRQFSRKVKIL